MNLLKHLILNILLLTGFWVTAQPVVHLTKNRRIILYEKDAVVEAEIVRNRHLRVKVNPESFYHWFDNNQLFSNQGGYSGWLLDGAFKRFGLEKHQLLEAGTFSLGLKTGEWKAWDEKGFISESVCWDGGKKHGLSSFYMGGKLVSRQEYRNGVLHGVRMVIQPDGTVVETRYQNGTLVVDKKWDLFKSKGEGTQPQPASVDTTKHRKEKKLEKARRKEKAAEAKKAPNESGMDEKQVDRESWFRKWFGKNKDEVDQ